MATADQRLIDLFARLDPADRRTLLDFAEFLAGRRRESPAEVSPPPRPAVESVVSAIKRLHRSFPGVRHHQLMPTVEKLLAQHMMENRPAPQVIDELEALFAAEYRSSSGA
ncbi:MAG: hypothetical protein WBP72_14725 [Rhodocyclaceae bacterium]